VLGVKYREGFIKNRYVGRTFIMPGQAQRVKSVRRKLNPIPLEFKGRVVLLVDDSIVRGTTSQQIIQMARDAGARKVYLASAAPPVRYPNIYGIDMPAASELIAHGRSEEEVQQLLGCDWLIYQDLSDLEDAVSGPKHKLTASTPPASTASTSPASSRATWKACRPRAATKPSSSAFPERGERACRRSPLPLTRCSRRCAWRLPNAIPRRRRRRRSRSRKRSRDGALAIDEGSPRRKQSAEPGRPALPVLVLPREVPSRGIGHVEGRAALLHAVAHIDFNAINLALDAAYRFRGMPRGFYADWTGVAADEARHFRLLRARLAALGFGYGDFPAHNGLWEMARKSAHSCVARMALVPRLLEARGLDVTPGHDRALPRRSATRSRWRCWKPSSKRKWATSPSAAAGSPGAARAKGWSRARLSCSCCATRQRARCAVPSTSTRGARPASTMRRCCGWRRWPGRMTGREAGMHRKEFRRWMLTRWPRPCCWCLFGGEEGEVQDFRRQTRPRARKMLEGYEAARVAGNPEAAEAAADQLRERFPDSTRGALAGADAGRPCAGGGSGTRSCAACADLWDYQANAVGSGTQRSAAIFSRTPDLGEDQPAPIADAQLVLRDHPEWGRSAYLLLAQSKVRLRQALHAATGLRRGRAAGVAGQAGRFGQGAGAVHRRRGALPSACARRSS
jgi:hypothetical protein